MCIQKSFCLVHEFQLSQLGTYIQKETQKQYNFKESSLHDLRCLQELFRFVALYHLFHL